MSDSQEMIQEFLVESRENLDRLDREFLELEKDPENKPVLSSIFRTIHTIKGTCGFLGFSTLESVAHQGENLLSRMRDGKIRLNDQITTTLLETVDAVRAILNHIETEQTEGEARYLDLIGRLTALSAGAEKQEAAVIAAPVAAVAVTAPATPAVEKAVDPLDAILEEELRKANASFHANIQQVTADSPSPVGAAPATSTQPEVTDAKAPAAAEATVRVDVALLDRLMNLVGELVLVRNQVLMSSSRGQDVTLASTSQRLNHITSELQEAVMKTRMQPINNVWNKLPRVVRDLAKACGKQVAVEMEGQETELDKTILEAIKDPITHIVRNSVDHGIETAEERLASGKPAQGTLKLRAIHEGGQVNIDISDDGAGIRIDKVKAKALQQGLIKTEQLATLTDRDAIGLIFRAGFSTAEKISNVSGRGVGMDVVKTNIEKIGGTVDLQSTLGRGTALRIKIPLTLAIIPALIISSGGERFAIPQVSLLELVRLDGERAIKGVEHVHGADVYRLRGNLLPLVDLNRTLRLPARKDADAVNIVVLQAGHCQFGLVVDDINDTEEIVVKPLGKQFKNNTAFAGATIMGDGRVALILDVMGLAQGARVISDADHKKQSVANMTISNDERTSMLVFRAFNGQRMAVPLANVARLEEVAAAAVETSSGREVMQYRGQILPLVRPGGLGHSNAGDTLRVVVCTEGGKSAGLLVESILDIAEQAVTIEQHGKDASLSGSAIIQEKVTDVIDVPALIAIDSGNPGGVL